MATMTSRELEKILDGLIRVLQVSLQSSEKITDDVQGEFARILENLMLEIEKAREAEQESAQPSVEIYSQFSQIKEGIRKTIRDLRCALDKLPFLLEQLLGFLDTNADRLDQDTQKEMSVLLREILTLNTKY